MKDGGIAYCPTCRERSFVRIVTERDGWTVTGQRVVCAVCDSTINALDVDVNADGESSSSPGAFETLLGAGSNCSTNDSLAAFLGTTGARARTDVRTALGDDGQRTQFCRDCINFVEHPFAKKCSKYGHSVDPMHSCADFELTQNRD